MNNKYLIAIFLAMCVIGFSTCQGKELSYNNTMEVGKTYTVDGIGRSTKKGDSINMYKGLFGDFVDPEKRLTIWTKYTTDYSMIRQGVVVVSRRDGDTYFVTPKKRGEYDTKTQHSSGDKTYIWKFV